ncbi:MAG: TRAP transporter TatT component family protein [Deltaproteobacteria bacterium]|nr:TRAP transporter TatT component family protein [Deltaproteobacteria bacterium]
MGRCRAWGAVARVVVVAVLAAGSWGCSPKRLAVDALGDALAGGGAAYARDNDPELIRDALPFALKTMEGLLEESPSHLGLLLAGASGFTQYAYAFLDQEADYREDSDLEGATALRRRALGLYRRATEYGLRGLEAAAPGFRTGLRSDAPAALGRLVPAQVPLLYWTAASWGAAISLAKHDPELSADLSLTAALMERALALDEGFGLGAAHDFFIAYDGGRPAAAGGSAERARRHLERALVLAKGQRAAPLVTFAETVSVGTQNRLEFTRLLGEALAVDVDAAPDQRLANLLSQRRARWLLGRADQLFLE